MKVLGVTWQFLSEGIQRLAYLTGAFLVFAAIVAVLDKGLRAPLGVMLAGIAIAWLLFRAAEKKVPAYRLIIILGIFGPEAAITARQSETWELLPAIVMVALFLLFVINSFRKTLPVKKPPVNVVTH